MVPIVLLVVFCLCPPIFAQRLSITPAAVTIVEGDSEHFTISLSSEPTGDVTVRIVGQNRTEISTDRAELTFTPENWNMPQTLMLSAIEDDNIVDDEYQLILIASGDDYEDEGAITVSPETAKIESVVKTVQLSAAVRDQDGHSYTYTGPPIKWSSADPSVAVVDSNGKVTGMSNGATIITAALVTASGAAAITIEDPNLIFSDREILEVLYKATAGDQWAQRGGWLTDASLDQWYGVETDENGQVTALKLRENGLVGIIPVELGSLAHLEILDLYNNRLTGILPPQIGSLVRLRELDLGNTDLEGEIPGTLGRLVELQKLNLETASFTGSIPSEFGALSKLQILNLYANRLSGPIPIEFADLRSLQILSLDENQLRGPIPSAFLQLEILHFFYWTQNNGLCLPETKDFMAWRTVKDRDFRGPYCNESDRIALEQLYADTDGANWTHSTGWLREDTVLSDWHGVNTDSLGHVTLLNLANNELRGQLPETLGNLNQLSVLNLANNGLRGQLPETLGNLNQLSVLDLANNGLRGQLPETLGNLNQLSVLRINDNSLTGRIPLSLAKLTLEEFRYANTDLCTPAGGTFQQWLTTISVHEGTDIRCRELSKENRIVLEQLYKDTDGANWLHSDGWLGDITFEDWYGVSTDSLGNVILLDLANNGLRGELPKTLGNLNQLSGLRINDNSLSGRMPSSLTKLLLEEFHYANTDLCIPPRATFQQWLSAISVREGADVPCPKLSDREVLTMLYETTDGLNWKKQDGWLTDAPLGDWYGVTVNDLEQVVELYLLGNDLRGQIPDEIGDMATLDLLDLAFNWLEGAIPSDLGEIETLSELYLQSNQLSGQIPAELGNLPLRLLYLDENKLEGTIPLELTNLSQLIRLHISWNQLSGPIPPELGNLSALESIWMDRNQFEGAIPPELGNLSSLEILHAGFNNLSGTIPPELGNLESIVEIAFDVNNLSGPIPPELGKLKNINGEINLDDNNLSGEIPAEMGNLTKLKKLRLARNNLSGSIPSEIGLMHALEWLDLSDNSELTGPIPSSFAGLDNVNRFQIRGTELCITQDSPLAEPALAWRFRIPFCDPSSVEEASTAYLSQSIQSAQYPIPLVAGKDALLRVFPISAQSTDASIPPVRATLFSSDGAEVYTVDIPGQSTPIPTKLAYAEASLDRSANISIPGSVIQPGLEMIINIDPDGTLDAGLEVVRRIPESGRLPLRVQTMPTLELTMIPFVWQTEPDNTAAELIEQMVNDPKGHWLLSETLTLLPVNDITVTAHAPVFTSYNNGDDILDEIGAIRALEGGTGYWMGALSGEATGPQGVAWINGWTSYARLGIGDQSGEPILIAHELGHSMSLYHAPCGVTAVVDPGYPYPNGEIGSWGIDSRSGSDRLIPPTSPDMMSYCGPAWISEYNFDIAMSHRLNREAPGKRVAASTPALLVWGGTDEEGAPYLNPVFAVNAPPSLPDGDGEYQLVGRAANGEVLFSVDFDMKSVSDIEGPRAGFAFAIPASPEWADALAEVELTGQVGSDIINADSNRPALILRERNSGHVRALLRGESSAGISLDAVTAAPLMSGTNVDALFSRGLPQPAQR